MDAYKEVNRPARQVSNTVSTPIESAIIDVKPHFIEGESTLEKQSRYSFTLKCKSSNKRGRIKKKCERSQTDEPSGTTTDCVTGIDGKSFLYSNKDQENIQSLNAIFELPHINIKIEPESVEREGEVSLENDCKEDNKNNEGEGRYRFGALNMKMFQRVGMFSDSTVECKICYKQIKESSMRQHFKTHSGLKPFKCSYCDAKFTRKGDVVRHRESIHQNIKPFKCDLCSKRFLEKKILVAHLKNHARMLYFSCSTCGFKFGKREYYESHIKFIHPLAEGESPTAFDMYEKSIKQLQIILSEENVREGNDQQFSSDIDDDDPSDCCETEYKREIKQEEDTLDGDNGDLLSDQHMINVKTEVLDKDDMEDSKMVRGDMWLDLNGSKCTLSFTEKLNVLSEGEEQLVDKAILSAASQSANVLENIQVTAGNNMTTSHYEAKQPTKSSSSPVIKVTKTSDLKYPEIHVTGNFGNNLYKFIIHIPQGGEIDPNTKEGMEQIVNIVNYVCEGKGPLKGSVHIEVKQSI